MRCLAILVLAALGACGGAKAATPATTTTSPCVRVSSYFAEQILTRRTSAPLGAAAGPAGRWYVANADGALWATNVDPAGATNVPDGFALPLNPAARAASALGSSVGASDPRYYGLGIDTPQAAAALGCA